MSNLSLPELACREMAEACGLRVRDAVNGYEGRERLRFTRVTPVEFGVGGSRAVLVWDDTDAPDGHELKCIWEDDLSEPDLIELLLHGSVE
jgi:hypothetical protein